MINSYFFEDPSNIPGDTQWVAYGPQHLIWLAAMGIICFIACKYFSKLDYSKQTKVLKAVAVWIVIQEILKDIIHYFTGTLEIGHLPLHICGISIFFTAWYAFSPNKLNGAYVYGMSMPGAFCALIFPNWTQYPLWHFSSINSFTIHGELILFALLALTSRRLVPDIKQIPKMTLIMVALAVPIYFLNKRWGTNFMFISDPSPGSPLMPLYDIFGDGYVLAAAVLLVLVWILLFLPWALRKKAPGRSPDA